MRKTFLKKAREALQEMRAQLLRNVQEELHEGREQTKDEGMDTYDLASVARDREINFILTFSRSRSVRMKLISRSRAELGASGLRQAGGADDAGRAREARARHGRWRRQR